MGVKGKVMLSSAKGSDFLGTRGVEWRGKIGYFENNTRILGT
jgi:hypothetical protein